MTTPVLAQQLTDGGHLVRGCRYCGRVFAADLDHSGRAHAPQRLYCSVECRDVAAGRRRSVTVRARRAHHRQHAGLIHLHELEAGGQESLIADPLPPVPALREVG